MRGKENPEIRAQLLRLRDEFGHGTIQELTNLSGLSRQTLQIAMNEGQRLEPGSWEKIETAIVRLKNQQTLAEAAETYPTPPVNRPDVLKEIDQTLSQMLQAARKQATCTNAQLGVIRGGVDYLRDVLLPEAQALIDSDSPNTTTPNIEKET